MLAVFDRSRKKNQNTGVDLQNNMQLYNIIILFSYLQYYIIIIFFIIKFKPDNYGH